MMLGPQFIVCFKASALLKLGLRLRQRLVGASENRPPGGLLVGKGKVKRCKWRRRDVCCLNLETTPMVLTGRWIFEGHNPTMQYRVTQWETYYMQENVILLDIMLNYRTQAQSYMFFFLNDSIHLKFKNRQNSSVLLRISITTTLSGRMGTRRGTRRH